MRLPLPELMTPVVVMSAPAVMEVVTDRDVPTLNEPSTVPPPEARNPLPMYRSLAIPMPPDTTMLPVVEDVALVVLDTRNVPSVPAPVLVQNMGRNAEEMTPSADEVPKRRSALEMSVPPPRYTLKSRDSAYQRIRIWFTSAPVVPLGVLLICISQVSPPLRLNIAADFAPPPIGIATFS